MYRAQSTCAGLNKDGIINRIVQETARTTDIGDDDGHRRGGGGHKNAGTKSREQAVERDLAADPDRH
ncbi:hypothetical protein C0V82_10475 [Niveispirillum cyanobacteriorum]|uniref:Uncharacterized protein n=1 Tax=Niveispirillum cyanobacteriorum TaxID=1612173 RepID=A0A2K9NDK5_9PROT|nr:hypothetical protein C0V82_10475 [Niveispirillum cyanobacteriorum]GGE52933.1 hypothetical protein GCM10011317_08970 [Niveispirillum cyanobacteriorum]